MNTAHTGFQRMFAENRLTLGVFFPIEAYTGSIPTMQSQIELAIKAEELGFAALWFRDVPLNDPNFGDVGQIFDPWVYLGYVAARTKTISLATGSIIFPLRHPLHIAKAAASVDQLSGGRLVLGIASGDRPVEFPAFGVDYNHRAEVFRETLSYFRRALQEDFPVINSSLGQLRGADLIPKPVAGDIPVLVTGSSRQTLDWIAAASDGWLSYPRPPFQQTQIVSEWHRLTKLHAPQVFKPFAQSLYIDLTDNPNTLPTPIHLGYRSGRNWLIEHLYSLQEMGVNHVGLNLKYGKRPASEVLDEVGREIVPLFPARETSHSKVFAASI
jgi:luciferase-type oxidoreductase